jgi:hypothetical protein
VSYDWSSHEESKVADLEHEVTRASRNMQNSREAYIADVRDSGVSHATNWLAAQAVTREVTYDMLFHLFTYGPRRGLSRILFFLHGGAVTGSELQDEALRKVHRQAARSILRDGADLLASTDIEMALLLTEF